MNDAGDFLNVYGDSGHPGGAYTQQGPAEAADHDENETCQLGGYMSSLSDFPPGFAVRKGTAPELRSFMSHSGPPPLAAVQPRDTAQIQTLIKWANQRGQKLVPVSSAEGPRRHGCTVPDRSAVIVDLSAMKRIRHVDGVDAIAVIEPGVTFPEFDAQLALHGLRSYKPLLPRRSKSVIASHLEREPITSPRDQWDGADPLASLQVVFGSGEQFRTGSGSISDDLETQLKHGMRQMASLGPFHTDYARVIMGSQGSLGIVSWASVYCERMPALETAYFVPSDQLAPLTELSSRIAWRKLAAQSFIVNGLQLALLLGTDRDSVRHLAGRLPAWSLFVNISALNYFPEERIAFETEALQEDAASLGLKICDRLEGQEANRITRMHQDLPRVHYKDRLENPHDEIFFLSHTDKSPAFVESFAKLHAKTGATLPYGVYIQPRVQSSSCHIEFTSFWDGSDARRDALRTTFHRDASHALSDAGAFFSRPYGIWKDIAYARDSQIVPHLRRVKEMFDPNAMLNPGKSC